jgi:hypothetical protein
VWSFVLGIVVIATERATASAAETPEREMRP